MINSTQQLDNLKTFDLTQNNSNQQVSILNQQNQEQLTPNKKSPISYNKWGVQNSAPVDNSKTNVSPSGLYNVNMFTSNEKIEEYSDENLNINNQNPSNFSSSRKTSTNSDYTGEQRNNLNRNLNDNTSSSF